jgi:hypothetical protein
MTIKHPGENFGFIVLLAWRHNLTLPRTTTIQLILNIFHSKWNTRRTTINDHTNTRAMGFAPSANTEECTEAARHRIDKMNGVCKCANVQREDWVVTLLPTLYDWRMIKALNLLIRIGWV